MVYNAKTFEPLHLLTPSGREAWQAMLEHEADMILMKHLHPFKWAWQKAKELLSRDE